MQSTQDWCPANFTDFISVQEWPQYSCGLKPLGYSLWSNLEIRACAKPHKCLEALKRSFLREWTIITPAAEMWQTAEKISTNVCVLGSRAKVELFCLCFHYLSQIRSLCYFSSACIITWYCWLEFLSYNWTMHNTWQINFKRIHIIPNLMLFNDQLLCIYLLLYLYILLYYLYIYYYFRVLRNGSNDFNENDGLCRF